MLNLIILTILYPLFSTLLLGALLYGYKNVKFYMPFHLFTIFVIGIGILIMDGAPTDNFIRRLIIAFLVFFPVTVAASMFATWIGIQGASKADYQQSFATIWTAGSWAALFFGANGIPFN